MSGWWGVVPVGLAASVLLAPGARRFLGPARALALGASLAVVLGGLLPEALDEVGAAALVVAAAGLLLPVALERWTAGSHRVGLGLAGLGVGLHQVADGLQMGLAGQHLGGGVVLAIALHSAPLVAAAVLAARVRFGPRAAWALAAGLTGLTALGVALAGAPGEAAIEAAEPWVQAAVAGLLLHALGHDLGVDPPPDHAHRRREWVAFLLGAAAVAPLLVGGPTGAPLGPGHLGWVAALADVIAESAPALLLGLALAATLDAGVERPGSAGVARSIRWSLLAPALGLETLVLSTHWLGLPFTALRVAGAVALGIAGGRVVAATTDAPVAAAPLAAAPASFARRWVRSFDDRALHVLPWVGAGLVGAAWVEAFVHPESLRALPVWVQVAGATVVALPAWIGAAAVTPLVAVLWAKGLSPIAAVVGLWLGPAANLGTLRQIRARYGARAAVALAATLVIGAWVLGGLAAGLPATPPRRLDEVAAHGHGAVAVGSALLLVAVALLGALRVGPRAWLAVLAGGPPHRTGVAHVETACDDGCGHAHQGDHLHRPLSPLAPAPKAGRQAFSIRNTTGQ